MHVDTASARRTQIFSWKDTSVCHDDGDIRLKGSKEALCLVGSDLPGLFELQVVLESKLFNWW